MIELKHRVWHPHLGEMFYPDEKPAAVFSNAAIYPMPNPNPYPAIGEVAFSVVMQATNYKIGDSLLYEGDVINVEFPQGNIEYVVKMDEARTAFFLSREPTDDMIPLFASPYNAKYMPRAKVIGHAYEKDRWTEIFESRTTLYQKTIEDE